MTPDEARAVLLTAFATDQEMDDDMKALIAKLLVPSRKPWKLHNPFKKQT